MAQGQTPPATQTTPELVLPYIPSLDLASMDKMADPCVNFYQYSCGGWKKNNPIPPDQASWSVYGKLYEDNLLFLRGILEQVAANGQPRDAVALATVVALLRGHRSERDGLARSRRGRLSRLAPR